MAWKSLDRSTMKPAFDPRGMLSGSEGRFFAMRGGLWELVAGLLGRRVSYKGGDKIMLARATVEGDTVTASTTPGWPTAFHWWMDSVGSFLVLTKSTIRIGQAGVRENDVAILGDLSSHHADIRTSSSGVLLTAHAATEVNGKKGDSFLLKDGDRIRLRAVELVYRRPSPWSSTSRLELASRHRLPRSMDAIVLLGETASIGPRADAVIRTKWPESIYLNWYQGRYWVRGPESLLVDGQPSHGCAALSPDSRIEGSWGTFRWEVVQRP
jgi:hypothetical protein